ncbi:Y4yA family PLP-dependent enzyme [Marivirga sp.]|uniref:Y4yA family PLP-dependent enzyme n=1 Tax=Marivirga sp. TaxID=2018662 RepID=UPI0025EEDEC5|nr:Y4yA family PLP-dependent enzyme [Marivirga sp.]
MNIEKKIDSLPRLQPKISDWILQLLRKEDVLNQLLDKWGSPVNLHNTLPFEENYLEYEKVLNDFELDHMVLFARKANKCRRFVRKAQTLDIGVDTASLEELKQSLECGVNNQKLVVTAAIKNKQLIQLAVKSNVLIILDNWDEAVLVQEVAEEHGVKAKVGIRVSGFLVGGEKLYSRFGFDVAEAESFVIDNFRADGRFSGLEYSGVHFHLNGYSISQRGEALLQSIELAEKLDQTGFNTKYIDIGGGFLMNYLQNESDWLEFQEELQDAVLGKSRSITFGNDGLGFQLIDGKIQGKLNSYPFWNETSKATFLQKILSYSSSGGKKLAELLRKKKIQLRMEPGRSLLDQTGMTIARVAFRKKDSNGDWLVGLEMNMTQMASSSADFLLDPCVINLKTEPSTEQVEVYFTGAYCLERDVLLKRKITLNRLPAIGDLVIFINTAGYMMHFFESNAHLFPLATNLFLKENFSGDNLEDFEEDS